ncbi:MAG: NifU family protein [Erysipelotrichaceae bacterium]|nr:NifU family protein [Erysipelotrichaceae bacterium]
MDQNEKELLVRKTIEKARPYLQNDGGDVEFVKLEDDIVYVTVRGACVGCMSLEYTMKEGVEALLLDEVEGIREVRLVNENGDYYAW